MTTDQPAALLEDLTGGADVEGVGVLSTQRFESESPPQGREPGRGHPCAGTSGLVEAADFSESLREKSSRSH